MLVLSRKTQEKIQIGDKITITIVRVKGQAVRVGIEAPDDVRVMRGELLAGRNKAARETTSEASHSSGETSQRVAGVAGIEVPPSLAGSPCHRGSSVAAPLHFAVEALSLKAPSLKGQPLMGQPSTVAAAVEVKSCSDGRCRVPGASLAPLMRRPQRLGPASVGSLTGRLR